MRSLVSPIAVSIRIGTSLVLRSSPAKSRPVWPGIMTSSTIRSKSSALELLARRGGVGRRC